MISEYYGNNPANPGIDLLSIFATFINPGSESI